MSVAFLTSCNKNHFITDDPIQKGRNTVLFERESKEPFILKKQSSLKLKASTSSEDEAIIDPRYYIGRSYDAEVSDVGSPLGIRYPVVDAKKLVAEKSDLFKKITINSSESDLFSFVGFDNYWKRSNSNKTVSGGLSLNFGIFSIGAKSKFTKTFSTTITTDKKRVYVELYGYFIGSNYSYLFSSNMIDNIKQNYLSTSFLNELYNSFPYEFVKNYGTFVIKDFNTGGRVNALFIGIYRSEADSVVQMKSMDNSISASFKFKKDGGENKAEIGMLNGNGSSTATSNGFSDISVSVRTFGGNAGIDNFTAPKSLDQTNFNLNAWANSLNDPKTHVLINFNENGLLPLSDFIMEENLARNIKLYIEQGKGLEQKELMEPVIECRWLTTTRNYGNFIVTLRTRFGDQLFLYDQTVRWEFDGQVDANNFPVISQASMNKFLARAREVASSKLKYYKLKVVALQPSTKNSSFFPENFSAFVGYIKEDGMKKYYDPNKKITYLLYDGLREKIGQNVKTAYSIHDDYILDTYGIRDWVSKLPSVNVSYNELKKYSIIAL